MEFLSRNPAIHRYRRRFFPAMALYVLCLTASVWIFSRYHPTGALAYLLALLPAIPIVGVIVTIGLYLADEKDEFQRNLIVQSMIWSMGGVLAATTVWGFLEMFVRVPHLAPYLVFPLFWFFVGVSGCILRVRYR